MVTCSPVKDLCVAILPALLQILIRECQLILPASTELTSLHRRLAPVLKESKIPYSSNASEIVVWHDQLPSVVS